MTFNEVKSLLESRQFTQSFLNQQLDTNAANWTFARGYFFSSGNQRNESSFQGWIILAIHTGGSVPSKGDRYYGHHLTEPNATGEWSHSSKAVIRTESGEWYWDDNQ